MLSILLLRTYSNNEDDGGDDVGGNYQEGELNENTVADAALPRCEASACDQWKTTIGHQVLTFLES